MVSDKVGWGVAGADPLVLLHDAPSTRRLVTDLLGVTDVPVVEKPIGYIVLDDRGAYPDVVDSTHLTDKALDTLLMKKMIPWNIRRMASEANVDIAVSTPSRKIAERTEAIRYISVDSREIVGALLDEVRHKTRAYTGVPVERIDEMEFHLADGSRFGYEHLVSTLPAPIFYKLWQPRESPYHWSPSLNYLPVTFVVSKKRPHWLTDKWCVVYDARVSSPLVRIGLVADRVQYEVTGRINQEDSAARYWVNGLEPVPQGVFTFPFGRIVQDVKPLIEPTVRVTFLGRFAEWKYSVLVNHVLDKVHGFSDADIRALNQFETLSRGG